MKVKNKIFYNFVKQSYKKVSEVEGKEEVYYKDHKLVVVVNDEEVGRRIYDIIKTLKEKNDEISAFDFRFMISKYFVEDEATIKIFSADITLDNVRLWSVCTGKQKLKYMLAFIKSMEEKGYILDETKFDSQICDRISDFLTFFSVEENEAVKKDEFKMISYSDYLIVNNINFESKMALTEHNEEYSVYDGNIKIYHNVSEGFDNFLQEQLDSSFISKEQIENLIINFDFNVIGYKFEIHETQGEHKLSESHFKNQYEIISFISKLDEFLDTAYDSYTKFIRAKTFILEDNVICIGKNDSFAFQFNNIKGIYDFITIDPGEVNQQMIALLFKLLLEYCNEKYGKMNRKRQFLRKNEIRYLPPYVSQEFLKYASGKKNEVDYKVATDSFMEFFYYHKKILSSINELYYYDDRYVYSPEDISAIYDYELESEYGIRFQRNLNEELNNDIEIVTYSSPKATSKLKNTNKVKRIQSSIQYAENVKCTKISKIIYGTGFSDCEGECFSHYGYVVELPKGRRLTDTMLLSLDSKEIYIIMANWEKAFGIDCLFSVPLDTIWVNDDYTFTINIWDKNFEIKELSSDGSFITSMVKHLIKIGYNPYVFEYNPYHSYADIISYIDETDSYCDEHKMYYKSSEGCPACKATKFFIPQDFKITSKALLYEDAYAKHYKIDEPYSCNFKVYKKENVNMAETEKSIDKIIAASITGQELELKQDAFVPVKKLIDCNNQFIGYIYDPIEFDNNLINILDITRLSNNKARLKCLIRLVFNIKELLNDNLCFTQNPFSDVYINFINKKIYILNIEFIRKGRNSKDTFKWTCDYVQKVISEDSHIPVDLSDCYNIESLLDKLEKAYQKMKIRCNIHNIYYSDSVMFCPECAKKENMSNLKITREPKDKIMKKDKMKSGGESWIYEYGKRKVAKVFKENTDIDINKKMIIISRILSRRGILENANNDKNVKFNFIIPQQILVDDKPYGYIMEEVQNAYPISAIRYSDQRKKIGYTMKDILELLIIVGQALEYLHDKANIYIGDLNGANILFDEQKNVYFLDFDGVGIDEIQPVFVTSEYIDPISEKTGKITVKDDWYSYAIQVFCYLTFTHPFNGLYTAIKDEEEVYMDISERMEQRISLLGNHGITPPDVTKSWDWMDEEMINKFLNIFEGDYRESIVSDLIRQYDRLFKNEKNEKYDDFIRINSKMMAKQYNPFTGEIDDVLNQYCTISHNSKKQYVSVLFEKEGQIVQNKFNISSCKSINNVLLTKDRKYLYLYSDTRILGIDVETKKTIYKKAKLPEEDVVLDGNTLYIAKNSENKSYVIEVDIDSDGDGVKESKISVVPPEQPIKKMLVKFNSKFLFVKKGNKDFDEVFCNDEKLCNIPSRNMYNILFDSITNTWLVLNDKGNGIVITHEGKYKEFNIEEFVDSNNIDNVQFNKERIFIPTYDYLYIITVKSDQIIARKMECKKIMTPYSKLYDIGTDGFSVITDNTFYDVRKE